MATLLVFEFPSAVPFGPEAVEAYRALAEDIATEQGLRWKVWTENSERGVARGVYLFDSVADAEHYTAFHSERLRGSGITDIDARSFEVNDALSSHRARTLAFHPRRMMVSSFPRVASANRLLLVAGLAAILAGLTGCAVGTAEAPAPIATPEASTKAPEVPADQPLVIPGCADLPVAAGLSEGTGYGWESVAQVGPDNYHVYTRAMGSQALAALEAAPQIEYCVWVRGETFGEVWVEALVAELDPTTRTELVESLRGSDYLESVSGETLMFSYELATDAAPIEIRYAFLENVWVTSISSPADGLPELVRDLVLESVRSQNSAGGA